jgi:flagellar biosynthetic protein FliO
MWIALPAFLFSSAVELPVCAANAATNAVPALAADLPDMGTSILRLLGSLVLVLGLFLGSVYLFRNWQRLALQRSSGSHLRIQEIKPLGHRHALYLVQCDQQRMLLASTPTGINFIANVEPADESTSAAPGQTTKDHAPFIHALQKAEGAGS